MRDQVILDIQEAYQQICEQQRVGVQLDEPTDEAAAKTLKKLIPKGDKVVIPKSSPSSMVKAAEEYDIFDDIVEFCEGMQIFDSIDESEYFADLLIQEDLTQTFVDDVLEYCSQAKLLDEEYITEISSGLLKRGLQIASGLLKKPPKGAVGLSAKTLTGKGIRSTGLSSKGGRLSGAARTDDIARTQAARSARRPPEPERANRYADLLAQKRATSTTAASSTPTPPSPSTRGTGPSYVAKRGVIDPLVTAMTLGMGHMAGLKSATNILKQMTSPIVQNVGKITQRSAPTAASRSTRRVAGAATDPWFQFPKTTNKPKRYGLPKPPTPKTPSSKVLTGSPQPKGLLPAAKTSSKPTFKPEALPKPPRTVEPAGALVPTRGPKPTFKPEALPKLPKTSEPAGALVPTRGPKPTFKPEALPKLPKTSEPAGALVPTRGPKQTLDTGSNSGKKLLRGLAAAGAGIAAGAGTGAAMIKNADDERKKRGQNPKPVYNTMDPSGRVRSRLAVGPKIVGPRKIGSTFDDAFREARRQGKKTFTYGDQEFTTKMAEEFFVDYLINEGFAMDVRSAQGIMNVMSEGWIQSIIES